MALLSACVPPKGSDTPAEDGEDDVDLATLDGDDLEFGTAAWGETVARTLYLSNDGEGDAQMGVGGIEIGPNMDGNFTVSWDDDAISCPDGATHADGTGLALFTLGAGCGIPLDIAFSPTGDIGEVWGALIVESVEESPTYFRDVRSWQQVVYLHGQATHTAPQISVTPGSYDFGFVYPGTDADPAPIQLTNLGDADLTVASVSLSSTCDSAFSLIDPVPPGTVIAPGESLLAEVAFTPTDLDGAYCQVLVESDDPYNPEVDVSLAGNAGTDPDNTAPTVVIVSPSNGHRYDTADDLELTLDIADADQPVSSLYCRVRSRSTSTTLADCTPTDETGRVVVAIPATAFVAGTDTLTVTVTDARCLSRESRPEAGRRW